EHRPDDGVGDTRTRVVLRLDRHSEFERLDFAGGELERALVREGHAEPVARTETRSAAAPVARTDRAIVIVGNILQLEVKRRHGARLFPTRERHRHRNPAVIPTERLRRLQRELDTARVEELLDAAE